uniref:Glutathione transferase n=1 Tax=Entomoneis paludosa TaxID=265537 RepID=A0A7S2YJS4_9STRA
MKRATVLSILWLALLSTPALSFAPSSRVLSQSVSSARGATLAMAPDDVQQQEGEGLTIYGHPGTRSPMVNWACYELGLNKVAAGDLSKNPHPFGQIPCFADGNAKDPTIVFESGAILIYLVQNYATNTDLTDAQKASIISWVTWANASLDPICFLETPDGKVYDTGLREVNNKRIAQLEALLQKQDGVLVPSAGFSIADVAVASYLLYVAQFFPKVVDHLKSTWPNIANYMKEAASRPAYAQAFGPDLQEYLVEKLSEVPDASAKKIFGMF